MAPANSVTLVICGSNLTGELSMKLDVDAPLEIADMKAKAARASDLLRSMSNEGRLMILCNLIQKERSVSELEELVGLSQSSASQHLAILRRERLVKSRRSGQNIFYSLASPEAAAILRTLYSLYCADVEAAADAEALEDL